MNFENSLQEGYVRKVTKDILRARSLLNAAEDALRAASELQLQEHNFKSIMRELYEALRQCCEAFGYLKGYKFQSHEVIVYFLEDIIHEADLSRKFDRYRKIRNGINYYGHDVAKETIEKALQEIPEMVEKLKKKS
ncbi:TPA: hypothetical protein HA241_06450 [Candidatus Woesearchaeota archaeon]|nr:hypothetical protein [Candidatus Woesearchaeota archaeon]